MKIDLSKIKIGTLASLASVITCVVLAFNVYTDIKNRLDRVLEHDEEFHRFEQRFRALECYLEVVNCQGVFAAINAPEMATAAPAPMAVPDVFWEDDTVAAMAEAEPEPEELDPVRDPDEFFGEPVTMEQMTYEELVKSIPIEENE